MKIIGVICIGLAIDASGSLRLKILRDYAGQQCSVRVRPGLF